MLRKNIALVGMLIGIGVLILQFSISIPAYLEQGHSLAFSLLKFLSYFTLLTNGTLVLIYLGAVIKGHRWLAPFRNPLTRATAAAAIFLVMTFYHFFIAPVWAPEGLFLIADTILHYVTPILYLFWFIVFNRSGTLRLPMLPKMLVAPAVYLVWVMGRGAIVGEYPYSILEVNTHGYPAVILGVLGVVIALTLLNAIAIFIDKSLPIRETK